MGSDDDVVSEESREDVYLVSYLSSTEWLTVE